ncbi:MAG: hypothetical protein ACRC8A_08600 [Microcoleaceae cyanobacterium]
MELQKFQSGVGIYPGKMFALRTSHRSLLNAASSRFYPDTIQINPPISPFSRRIWVAEVFLAGLKIDLETDLKTNLKTNLKTTAFCVG